jgi:hypothetical protein
VGIVRYGRGVPSTHEARGGAALAGFLTGVAFIASAVGLILIVRAISSGRLGHLFDLQDQLPVITGLGMAVGAFGTLALLGSLERAAASFGRSLEEQAMPLKIGIPIVAVGAGALKIGADALGPAALGLGIVLLVGAVVVLGAYLRLLGVAAESLRFGRSWAGAGDPHRR